MQKDKYNFDGKIFVSFDGYFIPKYCNYKDIPLICKTFSDKDFKANSKRKKYLNLPCAFDIETTSFSRETKNGAEKLATMYIWQLGLNGYIILGRTWSEFEKAVNLLVKCLQLNENKRIIIYIHNLSFEFQFIRKLFEWSNVFALDERKVCYCVSTNGVEFRCSYLLSGYNLETVAKNLQTYKIQKLVGSLDYNVKRHYLTELTEKEINYCVNDIKIIMLYIKEYLTTVKNIHSLPLTKTGAVRKFCRKNCFFIKDSVKTYTNYDFKNYIKGLKINDLKEFNALQRAFCGGFTHANANFVNETLENVSSFDFTSSYPAVMVANKFPVSTGIKVNVTSLEMLKNLCLKYCCIFDIEFDFIFSRELYENYISVSKCWQKLKVVENNGRIVSAENIALTITELDFLIICKMYTWQKLRVGYCYIYEKGYLPPEFVKCILTLYQKKTELKGIDGKENEYLNSKEMLNACYGMAVTNPLRNNYIYKNDIWDKEILTENQKMQNLLNYNISEQRFLFYVWGVYVTAYARYNLFTAINELKEDYIYSDTDSVKFLNLEKHKEYFENYNNNLYKQLQTVCNIQKLDFNLCAPKTKSGKIKVLGFWDFEGTYKRFKTLGAKRYLIEKENALTIDGKNYNFSLTVSGLNKKKVIPYLLEKYGENNIFAAFNDFLFIPPEYSGKNILTYFDYEFKEELTDYKGKTVTVHEKSGINISQSEYTLNLSLQFINYLRGIKRINL